MQKINLNTIFKLMAVLLLVFLVILMNKCNNSQPRVITKIVTKEVKGTFNPVKPIHDTIIKRIVIKNESDKLLQKQIDELIAEKNALQQFYNEASDSLKTTLFSKAIQIKSFTHTFDNDTIKATTSGLVQGEIQSIKLDYTIKPQKVDLPIEKENVFRLLGGFEYGNNATLSNSILKANLSGQLRNGNIIGVGLDNAENIYVRYDFSIFSIKGKKK